MPVNTSEVPNPLTLADLGKINDAISTAQVGLKQAEMAQRAGIDVTHHQTELKKSLDQLVALKQVYFPGQ